MHVIAAGLNVVATLTVMLGMVNAVCMPLVQIRADILLIGKIVLVEGQFVMLTRFAPVTKINVLTLGNVLIIRVTQLLVDLIACVLMGKKTLHALQGSGVQLSDQLCALILHPLRLQLTFQL